jgi:glutathione peroxidase-family protein
MDARFPVSAKIEVNGPQMHPIYRWLKSAADDHSDIEWNFGAWFKGSNLALQLKCRDSVFSG